MLDEHADAERAAELAVQVVDRRADAGLVGRQCGHDGASGGRHGEPDARLPAVPRPTSKTHAGRGAAAGSPESQLAGGRGRPTRRSAPRGMPRLTTSGLARFAVARTGRVPQAERRGRRRAASSPAPAGSTRVKTKYMPNSAKYAAAIDRAAQAETALARRTRHRAWVERHAPLPHDEGAQTSGDADSEGDHDRRRGPSVVGSLDEPVQQPGHPDHRQDRARRVEPGLVGVP